MPEVSVIIPLFNGERYIAETLRTVFDQTFKDFEVIAVDDGSTDSTRDVVAAFSHKHPVRYVWQPNQERARARNMGVDRAEGEYIAFLDQDDCWLPAKLERQIAAFESAPPQVGVVYARACYIDQSGNRLPFRYYKKLHSGRITRKLILGNFVRPSSVVVRRECFERLGGFAEDTVPADDWDLWLRFSSAYEFLLVEEPLVEYRVHPDQTCRNVDALADAMQRVLVTAFSNPLISSQISSLKRRSYSQAYLDIALSYYGISRMPRAREYVLKSLAAYPMQWTHRQFWHVLLRSILGNKVRTVRKMLIRSDR